MDQNKPLATLRDGRLKATIWENTNDQNEVYHTVTLAKTYEDKNGKLRDTHSLSSSEALRGASLLSEAHLHILDVRRGIAHERTASQDHGQTQDQPVQDDRPARFRGRGRQSQPQPGMER